MSLRNRLKRGGALRAVGRVLTGISGHAYGGSGEATGGALASRMPHAGYVPPTMRHFGTPGAKIPSSYEEQKRLGWWDK